MAAIQQALLALGVQPQGPLLASLEDMDQLVYTLIMEAPQAAGEAAVAVDEARMQATLKRSQELPAVPQRDASPDWRMEELQAVYDDTRHKLGEAAAREAAANQAAEARERELHVTRERVEEAASEASVLSEVSPPLLIPRLTLLRREAAGAAEARNAVLEEALKEATTERQHLQGRMQALEGEVSQLRAEGKQLRGENEGLTAGEQGAVRGGGIARWRIWTPKMWTPGSGRAGNRAPWYSAATSCSARLTGSPALPSGALGIEYSRGSSSFVTADARSGVRGR